MLGAYGIILSMNGKRLRIAVINLLAEIVDVLLFFLGSRIRLDLVTVDSVSNRGLRCVKGSLA